jgi:D-glycero-alpha-D-manno-heptose-7-phosphate kinase
MEILSSDSDLTDFGRLLDDTWQLKRSLSDRVSSGAIDHLYQAGRNAGALGGKLLGAGGGGFVLLFVAPEKQDKVRRALGDYLHVPFRFDNLGSQIVFYQP